MICSFLLTKATVLALLDFYSSFDTIDHSITVHRLYADFGFTNTVLQTSSSYLTDRTQYVSLINHCSAFVPYTQVLLMVQFLALCYSPCILCLCLPLLTQTLSHTIHLLMTYNNGNLLPITKYPSYFSLCSHVWVMSMLGQLRTCLNLMFTRQNSCLSPPIELGTSITCLLQWSEWKLPLRGRITYRHCRKPKLPKVLYSSNRLFGGWAADADNATPTFFLSVPAMSKLTTLTVESMWTASTETAKHHILAIDEAS